MGPLVALLAKAVLSGGKDKKDSSRSLPSTQVQNNAFSGLEFDDIMEENQPRVNLREDLWQQE